MLSFPVTIDIGQHLMWCFFARLGVFVIFKLIGLGMEKNAPTKPSGPFRR